MKKYQTQLDPEQMTDFIKLHCLHVEGQGLTQCSARTLPDGKIFGYIVFNPRVNPGFTLLNVETKERQEIRPYEIIVDLPEYAEEKYGIQLEPLGGLSRREQEKQEALARQVEQAEQAANQEDQETDD